MSRNFFSLTVCNISICCASNRVLVILAYNYLISSFVLYLVFEVISRLHISVSDFFFVYIFVVWPSSFMTLTWPHFSFEQTAKIAQEVTKAFLLPWPCSRVNFWVGYLILVFTAHKYGCRFYFQIHGLIYTYSAAAAVLC